MITKIYILVPALLTYLITLGQEPILELTFTAIDSNAFVQLSSIKVMNRTRGGDTVLYYPDTVLVLDYYTGTSEAREESGSFQVFGNYPNPVTEWTTVTIYVPEKDPLSIIVTDRTGRVILKTNLTLDKGLHSFRYTPGGYGMCCFTAHWRDKYSSIKIIQIPENSHGVCTINYLGREDFHEYIKSITDIQIFPFYPGDELLYIGYTDTLESGILDAPQESQTYTFQFATNIPCPGTPTVTYEGQLYNTIQVFSQCWLKENLNAGTMINGSMDQSNNGTIEKYCFDNISDSCDKYGGLYQWNEMMQYSTRQITQGICPSGWHLPTDEEWKVLEGSADSQYGIGDTEWDLAGARGFDAGNRLRTIEGWYNNEGGTDFFNVSLLPGGYRKFDATFHGAFYNGEWWSSTEVTSNIAWRRRINYGDMKIFRNDNSFMEYGFSVRCLRNE